MKFSDLRILTLSAVFLVVQNMAFAAESKSWIGQIEGDVKLDGHPARNGDVLKKGSHIESRDGTASLFIGGTTLTRVGKNTDATLSGLAPGELTVSTGKLRALVRSDGAQAQVQDTKAKPRFFIRTRTAVLGVRGTQVVVGSAADRPPSFLVIEGNAEVSVTGGPTVALGALQRFEVGSVGPVTVTAQQAEEEASQVAPATQGEMAPVNLESAPAPSAFDALGSLLLAPLDPIADSPSAKLKVGFGF